MRWGKTSKNMMLTYMVAIFSIMAPIHACAQGTETGKVLRIENTSGTESQQSKSGKVKREEAEGSLEMESLLEALCRGNLRYIVILIRRIFSIHR